MDLPRLYGNRFDKESYHRRNEIWRILCRDFFQKYIPENATVIDIGCGTCEFINNISCAKKYAVDVNPDSREFAAKDVIFLLSSATSLDEIHSCSIDVAFMSNFLEHMPSKDIVLQVLKEAYRVLRNRGRLLVLQPNIRFAFAEYWDFWDHLVPISDRSLSEVVNMVGFDVQILLPRLLPYTTKSKLPKTPILIRAYLKAPLLWSIFGKQAFCLAEKPCQSD